MEMGGLPALAVGVDERRERSFTDAKIASAAELSAGAAAAAALGLGLGAWGRKMEHAGSTAIDLSSGQDPWSLHCRNIPTSRVVGLVVGRYTAAHNFSAPSTMVSRHARNAPTLRGSASTGGGACGSVVDKPAHSAPRSQRAERDRRSGKASAEEVGHVHGPMRAFSGAQWAAGGDSR